LDDDCYPEPGVTAERFLTAVWEALEATWPDDRWWNTIAATGLYPRGYPYSLRRAEVRTVVHHGLWSCVADLDAVTQLHNTEFRLAPADQRERVPYGKFFPMCGMNLAFRPEVIPALYFLLMGREYPYDRFGDIWAGLFVKRIADHLNVAISSGAPSVLHARASNVWVNLRKEAPGLEVNEFLWCRVEAVSLEGRTFAECYEELADKLVIDGEYWDRLRQAMKLWTTLVREATQQAAVGRGANPDE